MLNQAYNPLAAGPEYASRPGDASRLTETAHRALIGAAVVSYDPAFGNGDSPHYGL